MSIRLLYSMAIAAAFACASGSNVQAGSTQSASVLTAEEMTKAHADASTAYDAVARLRPNWLAPHGFTSNRYGSNTQYATVFFDGQPYGDPSTLKNIPAYNVGSIRYYDVTQSGARFGIRGGAGGVIEVTSKMAGNR